MQINVGNLDRIARVVIGLILLSLPLWLDSPWRWLGLIGIMPLITGLAGRCLGYRLLGVSTCAERELDCGSPRRWPRLAHGRDTADGSLSVVRQRHLELPLDRGELDGTLEASPLVRSLAENLRQTWVSVVPDFDARSARLELQGGGVTPAAISVELWVLENQCPALLTGDANFGQRQRRFCCVS